MKITHQRNQYKHGLIRGLKGDWTSSMYILVPLIENSLRCLMEANGYNMIKIDADGIQQEKDLNSFIYNEELREIIGEDLQFQLQLILCDKTCYNLRNILAHGLATDALAGSTIGPYVWAFTLNLCFKFQRGFFLELKRLHDIEEKSLADKKQPSTKEETDKE